MTITISEENYLCAVKEHPVGLTAFKPESYLYSQHAQ